MQGLRRVHSAPRSVTLPKDAVRREANRVCSESLRVRRQSRRVEGDKELTCLQVAGAETLLHDTLASAG
jgi:hypothetical protein